jgi:AraC-like DNA-binding protein
MPHSWLPSVVNIGRMSSIPSGFFDWHEHRHDELCLVEGETTMGHDGKRIAIDTTPALFLFRRGEQHAFFNSPRQVPQFWVLNFHADEALEKECPILREKDAAKRMWKFSPADTAAFKSFFVKIQIENARQESGSAAAASAWLRLLLVAVQRWGASWRVESPMPEAVDPKLIGLWQAVNDHAGGPASLARALKKSVANYDSLRHRFARVFGSSPRQLMGRLRMERAKALLLESSMSVAEIAAQVGYSRQHEFARAFHREVGCTPSAWRKDPR